MLQQINRLQKRRDFQRAYQKGRRTFLPEFTVYVLFRRSPNDPTRFGIVVSNKITKKAVLKNKAKRLTREAVRRLLRDRQIPEGLDVVLLGKKEILTSDYHKIEAHLRSFFQHRRSVPPKKTI